MVMNELNAIEAGDETAGGEGESVAYVWGDIGRPYSYP
jgi:hypothetical protein